MYKESLPPANLSLWVQCFWHFQIPSGTVRSPGLITPDGCSDLIFDFETQSSYVIGAATRSIYSHKRHLLGVRFRPGAAHSILRFPLGKIKDLLIDSPEVSPEWNELNEKVFNARTKRAQIQTICEFLETKIIDSKTLPDRRILHAVQEIKENPCLKISEVAQSANLSRQHLKRLFDRDVGLTPKEFLRVSRWQYLKELSHKPKDGWTYLAHVAGYFDQAHMIDEVKSMTGQTPTQFFS